VSTPDARGPHPGHRTVRVALGVLAAVVLAGAALVIFTPLPAPAAGGTCGPSTGSETAAQAFFEPHSIGAGPRPRAGTQARAEWDAFVQQCQSAADVRMGTSLGLVLLAVLLGVIAPGVVGRVMSSRPTAPAGPPAGWFPDPEHGGSWRWWDGRQWGPRAPPPTAPPPAPS